MKIPGGLQVRKSKISTGNGLFFTKDILSISISQDEWITPDTVYAIFSKKVPISFYYLDLKFNHENSEYYKILPKEIDSALLWDKDSIEYLLLESSGMLIQIVQKKKSLEREFEKWFIFLVELFPSITFEEFVWAECLVKSRSMEVPSRLMMRGNDFNQSKLNSYSGETINDSDTVVVPWIDVANHSHTPNAAWRVIPEKGMELYLADSSNLTLENLVITDDSIGNCRNSDALDTPGFAQENQQLDFPAKHPGIEESETVEETEILISYGLDKGNQTLFFAYNFTIKNNPVKQLLFPVLAWEDESIETITFKRNLLREWGMAEKFEILNDELTPESIVVMLLSMSPRIEEFLEFQIHPELDDKLLSTSTSTSVTQAGQDHLAGPDVDINSALKSPKNLSDWLISIKMYEVTLLRGLYVLQEQLVHLLNGCQKELDEGIEMNPRIAMILNLRETNVRDISKFLPIIEQKIEKLAALTVVQNFLAQQE